MGSIFGGQRAPSGASLALSIEKGLSRVAPPDTRSRETIALEEDVERAREHGRKAIETAKHYQNTALDAGDIDGFSAAVAKEDGARAALAEVLRRDAEIEAAAANVTTARMRIAAKKQLAAFDAEIRKTLDSSEFGTPEGLAKLEEDRDATAERMDALAEAGAGSVRVPTTEAARAEAAAARSEAFAKAKRARDGVKEPTVAGAAVTVAAPAPVSVAAVRPLII
jgi:hypothetical protein